MWRYQQSSGFLYYDDAFFTAGYSGFGEGKNNPALQDHANLGPLPCGWYTIVVITDDQGNPIDYEGKKAPVFRLVPDEDNQMFGRAGFLIHGDSIAAPGTASHGCIIEDHTARMEMLAIVQKGNNHLEVVA